MYHSLDTGQVTNRDRCQNNVCSGGGDKIGQPITIFYVMEGVCHFLKGSNPLTPNRRI